jgi:hypothetical protein
VYFNTRTAVDPPTELLLQTPIGQCWVYKAYDADDAVTEVAEPGKKMMTISFLRFKDLNIELNKIFLQVAAAMIALHDERKEHVLFRKMPCFMSEEFNVSRVAMIFFGDYLLLLLLQSSSMSLCKQAMSLSLI